LYRDLAKRPHGKIFYKDLVERSLVAEILPTGFLQRDLAWRCSIESLNRNLA